MAVLTLHSCYDQYEVACAADLWDERVYLSLVSSLFVL